MLDVGPPFFEFFDEQVGFVEEKDEGGVPKGPVTDYRRENEQRFLQSVRFSEMFYRNL